MRQKIGFVVQKEGRKACRKKFGVAGEKAYWNQSHHHPSHSTLSHTIVNLNKTLRGQKNGSSPVAIVCHPFGTYYVTKTPQYQRKNSAKNASLYLTTSSYAFHSIVVSVGKPNKHSSLCPLAIAVNP